MLSRIAFALLVLTSLTACPTPPTTPQISSVANLVTCVFSVLTPDVVAHKPWSQCVEDAVATCGADATTVISLWAAHVNAETREGLTPTALIQEVPQSK